MKKALIILCILDLIISYSCAQDTLLDKDKIFGDLESKGITLDMTTTHIVQANTRGGLSTHKKRGRYTGRYDVSLTLDNQKLFGIENSSFYMHGRGSWPEAGGIDSHSVGSLFGVNTNAYGNRSLDIVEFWYQQGFWDNKFQLRVGKIDLTGGFECKECYVSFDTSSFANDETIQFMNGALVNNPTIPFPYEGLAVAGFYNPIEWWYISAAIADAQADFRETGFQTTFHDEDYFFSIAETGIVTEINSAKGPMRGAYRVGLWYDPQPKSNSDSEKLYRDDMGFYLSFDQVLTKENSEDDQGLGMFFRYGYAPSKSNDVTQFVSAGLQYQGLFKDRDNDILGFGFARGNLSNEANITYTEDAESVYEVYYNAQIVPGFNLTPSMQYIVHPGAIKTVGNATVLALRFHLAL